MIGKSFDFFLEGEDLANIRWTKGNTAGELRDLQKVEGGYIFTLKHDETIRSIRSQKPPLKFTIWVTTAEDLRCSAQFFIIIKERSANGFVVRVSFLCILSDMATIAG